MSQLARTPAPPYFAVIFSSQSTGHDAEGYSKMAAAMFELASKQPGYLGVETAHSDGLGITISYWETREDIANWKANAQHQVAQQFGKEKWYERFALRIARVEETREFERPT